MACEAALHPSSPCGFKNDGQSSEGQLTVGRIGPHGTAAVSLGLISCSQAAAEVCDKTIGESWTSSEGAVLYAEHPIGRWVFLAVAALTALAFLLRLKWLSLLAVPIAAAVVLAITYRLVVPDEIGLAEFREGCVSLVSLTADLAIFSGFALANIAMTIWLWRRVN